MKQHRLAVILMIGLICASARADQLTITLDSPTLTGLPGDVLQFFGTLSNTTGTDLFLNADNFNLAAFDPSAIDDSLFFTNAPLFLGANGSTGDIGLFNITIPNPFFTGGYGGVFQVLGGSDGNVQDVIGSASFTVQVQQTTTVPESSSVPLLSFVLLALVLVRRISTRPKSPCRYGGAT